MLKAEYRKFCWYLVQQQTLNLKDKNLVFSSLVVQIMHIIYHEYHDLPIPIKACLLHNIAAIVGIKIYDCN